MLGVIFTYKNTPYLPYILIKLSIVLTLHQPLREVSAIHFSIVVFEIFISSLAMYFSGLAKYKHQFCNGGKWGTALIS